MLPGSAQTVSDVKSPPMAAKLAARQQTSKAARRVKFAVSSLIANLRERVLTGLFAVATGLPDVRKDEYGAGLHGAPRALTQEITRWLRPPGISCFRYKGPTLKVYKVPPCGIELRLAALAIAVAPMAPNLSLRSRPAVTGRPIQPPMPDHTDTYCLPFTEYVIALPMTHEPSLRCHNTLPVARSTARKSPPRLP